MPQRHAAIAGGGIGGLAAALALSRIGWRVTVFERAPDIDEVGAGLQISPNASRILRFWNVLGAISESGLRPEELRIRSALSDAPLTRMTLGNAAEKRWGAPYLLAHRADIQNALLTACRESPLVDIHTGAEVTGFLNTVDGVHVGYQTSDGVHSLDADMLIGADGLRSTIRARMGLGPHDTPRHSGRTAWRALVPANQAPALALEMASTLWIGPEAHLVHYPLRGGSVLNIVAITQDDWRGNEQRDEWSSEGETAHIRQRFGGWHRDARDVINCAPLWTRWPLYDRDPVTRWSDRNTALLGDAAHPMLPFLAQGAAQAIEDADALAMALVRHHHAPIPALKDYEHTRVKRAASIQLASRRQGNIYHLRGPLALARHIALKTMGSSGLASQMDWIYDYRTR